MAKFCRTCAVVVVRIIVVKMSTLATREVCTSKECLKGYRYINLAVDTDTLIHSCGVVSIHRYQWLAIRVAVLRFIFMLNSDICIAYIRFKQE